VLDLGLFSFVVIVLLAVSAVLLARKRASPPKTVAVLPCRNLSGSQDDEYFSDGMTEELITSLGKIKPLEVVARTSAFTFKNKNLSPREIGRRLHVGALVECTVGRSTDGFRITVSLVDAADGHPVWSKPYERNFRDVFVVQDEISRALASALQVTPAPGSDRSLAPPTTSEQAHELYLRGRYFFALRTDETTLRKSVAYFDSATRIDPSYAAAYSGLSDAHSVLSIWGFEPPLQGFPVAKLAAQRAVDLDSALAEAHTSLGIVSMFFDHDGETARRELTHAIALDPRYPAAHLFYAWYLTSHGLTDTAVAEAQMARELDPLSIIVNIRVGTMLYFADRYPQALAALQSSLELDSSNAMTHAELARVFMRLRRCPEALGEIRQLPASFQNAERGIEGFAYAACGRRPEAEAMLKDLVNQWQHGFMFASRIALLEVAFGKHDEALAWLDSAIAQRDPYSVSFAKEPLFRPLDGDPRFHRMLAKAGLERR
jgi:serine/threonine-protein kinase